MQHMIKSQVQPAARLLWAVLLHPQPLFACLPCMQYIGELRAWMLQDSRLGSCAKSTLKADALRCTANNCQRFWPLGSSQFGPSTNMKISVSQRENQKGLGRKHCTMLLVQAMTLCRCVLLMSHCLLTLMQHRRAAAEALHAWHC